ncbi:MAG: response regulator transcription factor [Rhodocyclaceae bacterium]
MTNTRNPKVGESPSVILADDHPMILVALQELLRSADFNIVAVATSAQEVVTAACDDHPNARVIITDYDFGEAGDGMSLIERLTRLRPDAAIIVFSMTKSRRIIQSLFALGVKGFVSKDAAPDNLISAVRTTLSGRPYIDNVTCAELCNDFVGLLQTSPSGSHAKPLSKKEEEVVRLLSKGLSVTGISKMVQRSPKTISSQKNAAMRKLGIQSDLELHQFLLENRL